MTIQNGRYWLALARELLAQGSEIVAETVYERAAAAEMRSAELWQIQRFLRASMGKMSAKRACGVLQQALIPLMLDQYQRAVADVEDALVAGELYCQNCTQPIPISDFSIVFVNDGENSGYVEMCEKCAEAAERQANDTV